METGLLERTEEAGANGAEPEAVPIEPAVRSFDDFLSADPTPRRVHFRVGGQECWVDLLPMDAEAFDRIQTVGAKYSMVTAGVAATGEIDLAARNLFLVVHTLADYCLKRQQRNRQGDVEWYEVRPPAGDRTKPAWRNQVEQQVRDKFRRDRRFWDFLVGECIQENALDEESAKNS